MGIWNFFKKEQETSPADLVKKGLLRLPRGESSLPQRCIYCNVLVNKLQKVKAGNYLDYSFPYLPSSISNFILCFLDDMFGGIISYIFGKVIIVNLGICEKHGNFRLFKKFIGFSLIGISFVLDYILIFMDFSWPIFISNVLLIIFALCYLTYLIPILEIVEENSAFIYVKGCNKVFLDNLASWEYKALDK